jgi:hypothetical protein
VAISVDRQLGAIRANNGCGVAGVLRKRAHLVIKQFDLQSDFFALAGRVHEGVCRSRFSNVSDYVRNC